MSHHESLAVRQPGCLWELPQSAYSPTAIAETNHWCRDVRSGDGSAAPLLYLREKQ